MGIRGHNFTYPIIIITFLKVSRRPWEDMEIISAIFPAPAISTMFGK
jgi:hypothetical protein